MKAKMKSIAQLAAVAAVLTMTGCAVQPPAPGPTVDKNSETLEKIATYAERTSLSMQRLAALRGASAGLEMSSLTAPAGLDVPVSISWSGPLESFVKKMAEVSGYEYAGVMGAKPVAPVLVSVAAKNAQVFHLLADAGTQAGSAADIVVDAGAKKLMVKYPPTVRSGGYVVGQ